MSNSIFTRIISAYAKKFCIALIYELYDVGITHITTLRRSVELCSAGRFLHHPQNIFQKFSGNRLFDGAAIVLLTERESSTYSPAERG